MVPESARGELLREVAALVEAPTVLTGAFDAAFLALPRRALLPTAPKVVAGILACAVPALPSRHTRGCWHRPRVRSGGPLHLPSFKHCPDTVHFIACTRQWNNAWAHDALGAD